MRAGVFALSAALATLAPAAQAVGQPTARLRWGEGSEPQFVAEGLPAISEDGRLIAVALVHRDGERGNDNLAFRIRDTSSEALVFELEVLRPEEDGSIEEARVLGRMDGVNAYLASRRWQPLPEADIEHGGGTYIEISRAMMVHGLLLEVLLSSLHVSAVSRRHGLSYHGGVPWSAEYSEAVEEDCRGVHTPYFTNVYADFDRAILLLRIEYHNHTRICEDVEPVYRVLHLDALPDESECSAIGGRCSERCRAGFRLATAEGCEASCCVPQALPGNCTILGGSCRTNCTGALQQGTWCDAGECCLE